MSAVKRSVRQTPSDNQASSDRQPHSANKALQVFLLLAVAIMIGWLLVSMKFIFLPMMLALFATFLFNPPVEWLRRKGVPRAIGIILVLALAGLIVWLGGKYISASFVAFRDGFPKYEQRIEELISHARTLTEHFSFITDENLKAAKDSVSLAGLVGNTLNSFVNVVGYILVTLIFMLYFLPAFPNLPNKIKRAFPDERGQLLREAVEGIGQKVQKYIWAKTITSLITGAGVTVPCMIFGVDFAITWGVFAALLNFVPTIGALLSVIPPVVVFALQLELGQMSAVLWLTGILTVVMFITGNVLEPLMLGQSVNLSPTASLVALFLFGWLWGIIGMLIAVPAMAMVKFTCDNIDSLKPIGVLLSN